MNKILVICGPTAIGKTSLGICLAKKFTGEIVSADSRQVYQEMDIGTGKGLPTKAKLKIKNEKLQIKIKNGQILKPYRFNKIPVWMLDIVSPAQEFSLADYVNFAWKVISDIWKRKKLPIIVGGTGFYIKGLIDGIETLGVPPDWKLRRRLEDLPAPKLFDMLARLDPVKAAAMNVSDRKNLRRLIRAIEVVILNKDLATKKTQRENRGERKDVLFIGLMAPYRKLYQRIDKRIDEQIKMGAEEEVKKLLKQGYTWDLPAMSAMGYGVWKPYIENSKLRNEIIQQWKYDEHAYARRQMTWFKKDKRIKWFDISERGWRQKLVDLVKVWYNADIRNKNTK